jgi:hypothetical protein
LALLESVRDLPRETVHVVVTSKDGSRIPDALKRASPFPTTVQEIDDVAAFGQRTGIGWTPALIVLDSKHRLRLITESLTPAIRDIAVQQLRSWNTGKEK